MSIEKRFKELNFLQKKRISEYCQLKFDNNLIFQKDINFSIINRNIKNQNELENSKKELHSYSTNNYLTNNLKKSEDKSNLDTNNKTKNISEGIINNGPSTILKYFNKNKNINKKSLLEKDSNNEIKVFKNKKSVYINAYLFNSYSTSKNIKKSNKINFVIRKKRSSKYRGVSKNGSNWQVLIMINNKNYYIGSYPSEEIAARVYDILSIKIRGIRARTNFFYNDIQIKKIFENNINIKCDNISDIMKQIIN